MARPGPELYLILVSLHEATGSITTQPWKDASPFHRYSPPPPFTPLAFYQVSLTNFCYPFILLGGDRHCKSKVFCTRTQHIDWNPDLLTLSPAQARPGYKCRPLDHVSTSLIIRPPCMSLHEGRVYAESPLMRNKLYNTKEKLSYLIFK